MNRRIFKSAVVSGVTLASALIASGAQAHECRALGQVNDVTPPSPGQYWVCAGFAIEDESIGQPGEGKSYNLDFLPFFYDGLNFVSLDTRQGDTVVLVATLDFLNNTFIEPPLNQNGELADPLFFFKTSGVGYESPISTCIPWYSGCTQFTKVIANPVPVDIDDGVTYRRSSNFVLPYPGMYAWTFIAKLQKQGQKPIDIKAKWVSDAPRVPYGPFNPDDVQVNNLVGAPEGWFDSVRPANSLAAATTVRTAVKSVRSSPHARAILTRVLGRQR